MMLPIREEIETLQLSVSDTHLFVGKGCHYRLYEKLGAHLVKVGGKTAGVHFAVWAPDALEIALSGGFNGWTPSPEHMLEPHSNGVWTLYVPGIDEGETYKYSVKGKDGVTRHKSDPFAFSNQYPTADNPLATASIVRDISYQWNDKEWLDKRADKQALDQPISIYELQIGSWMRGEGNRWLTYRELAPKLAAYVREMGYTHVEFMPVSEYYSEESWGYQVSNYFAPSSRFGSPQDFMFLVDCLHQNGIGVIIDWTPAHFAKDEAGLYQFDGTHAYSHADSLDREQRIGWGTNTFNYARHEVRSFLISNALFWMEKYRIDGIRTDAVSGMVYRNFSRKPGEWVPNTKGDRENLEAIRFLMDLNMQINKEYKGVLTIAEESTDWPVVTGPVDVGGLDFSLTWAMGWMNDTLTYLGIEPDNRKKEHEIITLYILYAFLEKFVLPLSHDTVVHLKKSLRGKMPGDERQVFANLRLLYANQYSMPGKPLLFMGGEFGQAREWDHTTGLDWHLLGNPVHAQLQNWVKALNGFYRSHPALYQNDYEPDGRGFEWIDKEGENGVMSFIRKGKDPKDDLVIVFNHTPVAKHDFRQGVPADGQWEEVLNSDAREFGGTGVANVKPIVAEETPWQGRPRSISLAVPPLGAVFLKRVSGY